MTSSTGTIAFRNYHTWYTVFGELSTRTHRPLVVLHGGPAIPHHYLLSIGDLSALDIPVIFYDQLGCGNSTHLDDEAADFWTIDLFLEELDNLLMHFGIQEDYDLLGHSWGGILVAEHAIKQPPGLKYIVLSSAPASMALGIQTIAKLRSQLPLEIREILDRYEKEGRMNTPEGREAALPYRERHLCRLPGIFSKREGAVADKTRDPNRVVHSALMGKDYWECNGSMKDWTIVGRLSSIRAAALVINGKYDQSTDEVVMPFVEKIPSVKWVKFEESSHMPHLEEPEEYRTVVAQFLSD